MALAVALAFAFPSQGHHHSRSGNCAGLLVKTALLAVRLGWWLDMKMFAIWSRSPSESVADSGADSVVVPLFTSERRSSVDRSTQVRPDLESDAAFDFAIGARVEI
jgi:hypothetical protein